MPPTITRKSDLQPILNDCLKSYTKNGIDRFLELLHQKILARKVKFPILEFAAKEIHATMPRTAIIPICNEICRQKTIGGNVLIGILLQSELPGRVAATMDQAAVYIADADDWYVPDIIGERVNGRALLDHFPEAISTLHSFRSHPSEWVRRSIGAGSHYAIKKGLPKEHARPLFELLLSMATATHHQVRTGIGWAAKTTARFHPDLIAEQKQVVDDPELVHNWFRRKVEIGLKRPKK